MNDTINLRSKILTRFLELLKTNQEICKKLSTKVVEILSKKFYRDFG